MKINLFAFGLIAIVAAQSSTAADITSGLQGHWNFDSCTTSATVVADASGNNRSGVVNGSPQCVNGYSSKAYKFLGGMDENIEVPNFPNITGNISVSAVIKPNSITSAQMPIVTKGRTLEEYTLWVTNSTVEFLMNWNTGGSSIWCKSTSPISIDDGQYHQVGATYNQTSGVVTLYDQGKSVGICNSTVGSIVGSTESLYISSSYPGGQEYFTGLIDNVRIYNRTLSDSDMSAIYLKDIAKKVSGSVLWSDSYTLTCTNVTQNVTKVFTRTNQAWNCETLGVPVNPGDLVTISISANKNQ